MQDHGSDFSPDELDRLEDALADLGGPVREELPARLRERLGEYDAILALARDAMPLEEPSTGLLDAILEEARQQAPVAAPPRARGPSLWERLRRSFLLPGAALAGTAALLLWLAQPGEELAPQPSATAPAPAAPEARSEAPQAAVPADMPSAPERKMDSPADEAASAAKDAAPAAALSPVPFEKPRAGSAGMKTKKAEAPAPLPGLGVPEAERVDADKESVRDQLERGDAAREKGRCADAEDEYAAVARSNGPAAERARALVGLGLCREAAGQGGEAERYFDAARALDPSVARLISRDPEADARRKAKAASKQPLVDGL